MNKLAEQKILNIITYFAENTKHLGITKLAKLLFYVDFQYLKETGKSMTGLTYYTYPKGPLPKELHNALKEAKGLLGQYVAFKESTGDLKPITTKNKFDPKCFSKRELEILKNTAFIFQDATADQMVKHSHLYDQPWDVTMKKQGLHAVIDEKLAFDGSKGSITVEEYEERKKEAQDLAHMLYGKR